MGSIGNIDTQITSIGNYINSRYGDIKRLNAQLKDIDNKISTVKQSLKRIPEDAKDTRAQLEEKLPSLHEQRENLRHQINAKQAEIEKQNARIKELKKKKTQQLKAVKEKSPTTTDKKDAVLAAKTKLKTAKKETFPAYDPDKHKKALLSNPKIKEKLQSGEYNLVKGSDGKWKVVVNEYAQEQREKKENTKAHTDYLATTYQSDAINTVKETPKHIASAAKDTLDAVSDIAEGISADKKDFAKGMENYYASGEYFEDLGKQAKTLNKYRFFKPEQKYEETAPHTEIPEKKKVKQTLKKTAPISPEEQKRLEKQSTERVKKDKLFFANYKEKIDAGEGYAIRNPQTGILEFIPKENALKENAAGMANYYTSGAVIKDVGHHLDAAGEQAGDSIINIGKSILDPIGTAADTSEMISQIGHDPVKYAEGAVESFKEEARKDPAKITKAVVETTINTAMIAAMYNNKMPSLRLVTSHTPAPSATKKTVSSTKPAPAAETAGSAPEAAAAVPGATWNPKNIKTYTITGSGATESTKIPLPATEAKLPEVTWNPENITVYKVAPSVQPPTPEIPSSSEPSKSAKQPMTEESSSIEKATAVIKEAMSDLPETKTERIFKNARRNNTLDELYITVNELNNNPAVDKGGLKQIIRNMHNPETYEEALHQMRVGKSVVETLKPGEKLVLEDNKMGLDLIVKNSKGEIVRVVEVKLVSSSKKIPGRTAHAIEEVNRPLVDIKREVDIKFTGQWDPSMQDRVFQGIWDAQLKNPLKDIDLITIKSKDGKVLLQLMRSDPKPPVYKDPRSMSNAERNAYDRVKDEMKSKYSNGFNEEKIFEDELKFRFNNALKENKLAEEAGVDINDPKKAQLVREYVEIETDAVAMGNIEPASPKARILHEAVVKNLAEEASLPNGQHVTGAAKTMAEACDRLGIKGEEKLQMTTAAVLHDPPNKIGFGPKFLEHNLESAKRIDEIFKPLRDSSGKLSPELEAQYQMYRKIALGHQEAPAGWMAFCHAREITLSNLGPLSPEQTTAIGNMLWGVKNTGKLPDNFFPKLRQLGLPEENVAKLEKTLPGILEKIYNPAKAPHKAPDNPYEPYRIDFTEEEQVVLDNLHKTAGGEGENYKWYVQNPKDPHSRELALMIYADGKPNYCEPSGLRKMLPFSENIETGYKGIQGSENSSFADWMRHLDDSIPGVKELKAEAKAVRQETEDKFFKALPQTEKVFGSLGYSPEKPLTGSPAEEKILKIYNTNSAKYNAPEIKEITDDNWAQVKKIYKEAFLDDLMERME